MPARSDPDESAAPATKSVLYLTWQKCCAIAKVLHLPDLAKVLRLPLNPNLAKPSRGRANVPISEPVPGPRTGVKTELVERPSSRTRPTCSSSGYPPVLVIS